MKVVTKLVLVKNHILYAILMDRENFEASLFCTIDNFCFRFRLNIAWVLVKY